MEYPPQFRMYIRLVSSFEVFSSAAAGSYGTHMQLDMARAQKESVASTAFDMTQTIHVNSSIHIFGS